MTTDDSNSVLVLSTKSRKLAAGIRLLLEERKTRKPFFKILPTMADFLIPCLTQSRKRGT